jgi:hypothetical protein
MVEPAGGHLFGRGHAKWMNIAGRRYPPLFVRVKDRLSENLVGRFLASSGSLKVAERKRDSGCGVSSVCSHKNEDDKCIGQLHSLRVNGPAVSRRHTEYPAVSRVRPHCRAGLMRPSTAQRLRPVVQHRVRWRIVKRIRGRCLMARSNMDRALPRIVENCGRRRRSGYRPQSTSSGFGSGMAGS